MISKATEGFYWDKAFLEKSANEKIFILTKTILRIISNFIHCTKNEIFH